MTEPPPSISVVIPVYNEAAEVANIVSAVDEAMRARGGEYEVIVVDNASEDDTANRVRPFLTDRRIHLLQNEHNMGKGFSVRRGMLEATGDLRLMCDADCAPSLASLPKMEAKLTDCDIVAGARNAPDSQVERYQPLRRRVASLGFIFLCRRVMGEPLRDVFCGFKLFTADAAEDVFSRSRIDGWAFDAEALALARALGYRVTACGIAWVNRPGSRLSIPKVVIPVLKELVVTRGYVREEAARAGRIACTGAAPAAAGTPLAYRGHTH